MRAGCAVIVAILVCAQTAWADAGAVAVLPWTASSPELELYGEPLARAVVKRLAKTGVRSQAITAKVTVPKDVELVIDGRLVGQGDQVRLEARVRDPRRGRALSRHATAWSDLAKLDELADELARSLAAGVDKAFAERAKATAAAQASAMPARTLPDKRRRPRMLVVRVAGQAAGGSISVTEPATRAALDLVFGLDFEPVLARELGMVADGQARQLVRAYDATHALVVYVGRVDFSWKRVLTARGRVRIVLYDANGERLFDRWFATDTLVGSRGDAHGALVYFVVEQAGLIALPMLRRALR